MNGRDRSFLSNVSNVVQRLSTPKTRVVVRFVQRVQRQASRAHVRAGARRGFRFAMSLASRVLNKAGQVGQVGQVEDYQRVTVSNVCFEVGQGWTGLATTGCRV